jgi:hypothetical protein
MSLNTKRVVIFVLGLCLVAALIMVADQERRRHLAPGEMGLAQLSALVTDDSAACIDCHGGTHGKSPGIVAEWANSKHAEKGVGCDEEIKFVTEAEHVHSSSDSYIDQFEELKMRLGMDGMF